MAIRRNNTTAATSAPSPSKPRSGGLGITTTPFSLPFMAVIHGKSGVGKTTLAAQMRRPNTKALLVTDNQEKGINRIMTSGRIKPGSVAQLTDPSGKPFRFPEGESAFERLLELQSEIDLGFDSDQISTIIYDSVTGFEKMARIACCAKEFHNDWSKEGFTGYAAGPETVATRYWPRFIDGCLAHKAQGFNVVVICHSHIKQFTNPDGEDYDRWEPFMDRRTWKLTERTADVVFFVNWQTSTQKKGIRHKATDAHREVCTRWSPAYDAKGIEGIPERIPFTDEPTSQDEVWKAVRPYLLNGTK